MNCVRTIAHPARYAKSSNIVVPVPLHLRVLQGTNGFHRPLQLVFEGYQDNMCTDLSVRKSHLFWPELGKDHYLMDESPLKHHERRLLFKILAPNPSRSKWKTDSGSRLDFCKTRGHRPVGTACWLPLVRHGCSSALWLTCDTNGDDRDDFIRYRPALLSLSQ